MARSSSPALSTLSLSFAFVAIVGCGGASPDQLPASAVRFDACRPLTLVADDGVAPNQTEAVRAAMQLWNERAHTRLVAAAPGDASADIVPVHFKTAASFSHGFFDPQSGQVLINNDLSDHALAVVIAHEVGHAFGLAHITGRPSVMAPGNLDVEPTAEDVGALAALWGPCAAPVDDGPAP